MRAIICANLKYKPGDPRPDGYLEWHEWARVQHRAGLRQRRCPRCYLWHWPQEEPHVCVEVLTRWHSMTHD